MPQEEGVSSYPENAELKSKPETETRKKERKKKPKQNKAIRIRCSQEHPNPHPPIHKVSQNSEINPGRIDRLRNACHIHARCHDPQAHPIDNSPHPHHPDYPHDDDDTFSAHHQPKSATPCTADPAMKRPHTAARDLEASHSPSDDSRHDGRCAKSYASPARICLARIGNRDHTLSAGAWRLPRR